VPASPRPSPSYPAVVDALRAAGCVFAEEEADLLLAAAAGPAELATMVDRRAAGEPLEQVVGWAEFAGLRIGVAPGVFVPRRRTEFLVAEAVARARPGAVVLDLCCGSGALAAAVAAAVPDVELHAADVEPAAVRCARGNLAAHHARVYEGDLYAPLPAELRGRVDLLLANTPYVPTDEIALLPTEARDHEPRVALDGGSDGLDVQRRVAAGAVEWLAPGGSVFVEATERQLPRAVENFTAVGLRVEVVGSEELDATVVVGTREA
jgi:release factor glutamine methyltransferase